MSDWLELGPHRQIFRTLNADADASVDDGHSAMPSAYAVSLAATQLGTTFQWGAFADLPGDPNSWVVVSEVPDPNSSQTM